MRKEDCKEVLILAAIAIAYFKWPEHKKEECREWLPQWFEIVF